MHICIKFLVLQSKIRGATNLILKFKFQEKPPKKLLRQGYIPGVQGKMVEMSMKRYFKNYFYSNNDYIGIP